MHRTVKSIALASASVIAMSLLSVSSALCATLSAQDSAAARQIVGDFVSAWNAHDMQTFGTLFTEDADFINVVGVWMKGRGEIEKIHTETHNTMFKTSTLAGAVSDLDVLCPDVAVMHMSWTLTGHRGPDMKPAPEPRTGILTLVAVRGEGRWLIHSGQNTDIVPGAMVPPTGK